eukprot:m.1275779 g.1275779  ORF g.1275779 m.1275779 type:complete len:1469 (+) comp24762_c0_seq12:253-4659(+)
MSGKVKWWEAVEEPTTTWRACVTEDGLDYYVNTETNVTTWDKPEELMTADEMKSSGDWVWIPDKEEVFVPAKKCGTPQKAGKKGGRMQQVELKSGDMMSVKEEDCTPFNRSSLKRVVADLTLLDDMTPQLILHNLKKRFSDGNIYTNVGTILISINPYKRLPLYTDDVIKRYMRKTPGQELPPHVFNIAHDAYYGITGFQQLQSIVISGESGAGKTEATKQCLQYLAAIAGSETGVENKILMANPILEAFGNAKTLRNDNSSRFGKYIEVYMNEKNKISGCQIKHYLLEKVRVSQPGQGERNFHVFYQLCKAAEAATQQKLSLLRKPAGYHILSSCSDVATINDTEDFKELTEAFIALKFSPEEVQGLYSVLGAILALGNLTFVEHKADQAAVAKDARKHLTTAADILQLDQFALAEALVSREIKVSGQETTKASLTVAEASATRFALCKFVYGKMFDWLVGRINRSFNDNDVSDDIFGKSVTDAHTGTEVLYVGILDIFGFEILQENSFEQLCINFTNEMLQQHFNNNTFKIEEKVYTSEGIDFEHVEFIDNEPMIELITANQTGILPILDEELVVPNGSDKGFLEKLADKQGRNPVFSQNRKKFTHFFVSHYAGKVEYDGEGFLEKNRDALQMDLVEVLQKSDNALVQVLYPDHEEVSSKDRKASLSKQFQRQLRDLMKQLYRTEPHYIRCVKPNADKAPLKFVSQLSYEQLTYSGVFEAVAIRKQGYPFRLSHEDFAGRYAKICKGSISSGSAKGKCEEIIKKMKLDRTNIRIGNTRVLYRAMEYRKMELEWEIITKNERILEALETLTNVDSSTMDHDEKENYIIRLADAVRQADLFRIKTKTAEKGRAMLEHFVEERMDPKTKRQLEDAIKSMNLDKLQTVLEVCEREGYLTKLVRRARELCEQIEDAEAALNVAVTDMNEEFLERALAMCAEFSYDAKTVQHARTLLKNIKKAKKGITKALVPPYKAEWLNKAVEYCRSINFTSFDGFVLCNTIRQSVVTARKMLTDAQSKKDQGLLEAALNFCYDVKNFNGTKYKCTLESECKELLKRVTWVNTEAAKGMRECEENQVRAVVAEAEAIGMKNKDVDHLRKLVKGDYGKFLAEQFKKAKKCKHHARAIRVSIKLKDREMNKKNPSSFDAKTYAGLKDPLTWSKEKFCWGSYQKRADGMMIWQAPHLHAPLTKASAQIADPTQRALLTTQILNAFDTVQKFMGERNTLKMPFRLHELIVDGLHNEPMRDEVYLFLMKQCTGNQEDALNQTKPGWRSHTGRAMELMAFCLCFFPPSTALEDYVEAFVRKGGLIAENASKFNLKGLLRRRVYHGLAKNSQIPPQEVFAPGTQMNGKRYGHGALDAFMKTNVKLDEFKDTTKKVASTSGDASGTDKPKDKKKKKKSKEKKEAAAAPTSDDPASTTASAWQTGTCSAHVRDCVWEQHVPMHANIYMLVFSSTFVVAKLVVMQNRVPA